MDKRVSAFNSSCYALSTEIQKSLNLETFNQGYGMTSSTVTSSFDVSFAVKNYGHLSSIHMPSFTRY